MTGPEAGRRPGEAGIAVPGGSESSTMRWPVAVLVGLGAPFAAGCGLVRLLSAGFPYGRSPGLTPLTDYVLLAAGLGLACAALAWLIPKLPDARRTLAAIFVIGLAARLVMFGSLPVLEDDWHRYLWDGAVVAAGADPYAHAPADATPVNRLGEVQARSGDPDLAKLQDLAAEAPLVYWRINYPYFKTIYPPLAQGAFALAHGIAPFSLDAWRAVLLAADLASFALIGWTLTLFGRSPLWAGLYWWNPVVILEGFNSGHMDVLVVPFLVAALALARLDRLRLAVIVLAGATAVKLWPVLLAPALIRTRLFRPWQVAGLAAIFLAVAGFLLWPQLAPALGDPDQGLVAYSEGWRRHSFLFAVLADGVLAGLADPDRAARIVVAIMVASGALVFAVKSAPDGRDLPLALAAVTALLIFLSPTGYPWYQIWLAAFIPFVPRAGFLALVVASPFYYFRFLFGDEAAIYQWGVVPVAFGVPLAILAAERWLQGRRKYA